MKKAFRSLLMALVIVAGAGCGGSGDKKTIRIGAKNFTEQFILGELMAQLIEAKTTLRVERVFNLGGTMICHNALANGDIDLYPEYTGTALVAILKREVISSPEEVYRVVAQAYKTQFHCEWLQPFGFNNTYAITVRKADAASHKWAAVSDLKPEARSLRAGFTAEFAERPDGYPGLKKAYGFSFGSARDLDSSLMYLAITRKEVDVICAFATDGRIAAYDLLPLKDDQGFFPPYYAAPVVRAGALRAHPELRKALAPLGGLLNDAAMQALNFEVDEKKRSPKDVAAEFLSRHALLGRSLAELATPGVPEAPRR